MLIVVVVLTTLMTIVFKLSNIGGDSWRRSETISRMQKLENCLSGYYAAFGSYPPVALHGSRSINTKINDVGVQSDETGDPDWGNESKAWNQIQAACKAQPMACNFPFSSEAVYQDAITALSDTLKEIIEEETEGYEDLLKNEDAVEKFKAGFDGLPGGSGRLSSYKDETDWRKLQLFRFGVMSFLLPRYLFMVNGDRDFYDGGFSQWEDSNTMPSNPFTGYKFSNWNEIKNLNETGNKNDLAKLANIPSQAVCARWMPNLAGICSTVHSLELFGVEITDNTVSKTSLKPSSWSSLPIYTPGGSQGHQNQYMLDSITVLDGWENDFYYYSPAPYQRYTLWSAGPNKKTFPPWVSRGDLSNTQAIKMAANWVKDDIISLSN